MSCQEKNMQAYALRATWTPQECAILAHIFVRTREQCQHREGVQYTARMEGFFIFETATRLRWDINSLLPLQYATRLRCPPSKHKAKIW